MLVAEGVVLVWFEQSAAAGDGGDGEVLDVVGGGQILPRRKLREHG